jgi:hypothetical protein
METVPASIVDLRLRAQLASALPDAAYNMLGFRIGKSVIAGYAAFTKQRVLYLSPSAIKSHADDIAAAGLKSTKTGVTFSPSQPPSLTGSLINSPWLPEETKIAERVGSA